MILATFSSCFLLLLLLLLLLLPIEKMIVATFSSCFLLLLLLLLLLFRWQAAMPKIEPLPAANHHCPPVSYTRTTPSSKSPWQ